MTETVKLSNTLYLIDPYDLGLPERTSSFIIKDEKIALIETSSSPSLPYILDGLRKLDIEPEDVDYLILTHIHLDHGGGAGLFMEKCPNAKLLVHPKGERHLIDPSRLIASAKSIYGDKFDALYDPILPVPADRIETIEHESTLSFGDSQVIFYHTRGHADHHISMLESSTNGIFAGDTTGVFYQQLKNESVQLIIPSTSPNQFDPDLMEQSIQLFESLNASQIYFGHFGVYKNPENTFAQVRYWLPLFIKDGEKAMHEKEDFYERSSYLEKILMERLTSYLISYDIPEDHPVYEVLPLDIGVNAMGIIDYLTKRSAK